MRFNFIEIDFLHLKARYSACLKQSIKVNNKEEENRKKNKSKSKKITKVICQVMKCEKRNICQ